MVTYSSKIEVAIAKSPVSNQAVDLYVELAAMTTKLEESRCNNLKRCVNETRNYWKQKLNDKISRQAAGIQYVMSIVTCIVSFHH